MVGQDNKGVGCDGTVYSLQADDGHLGGHHNNHRR